MKFTKIVFWKVCTRLSTPNKIRNVRTRNQSRSIEAELSEVEDHGGETQKSNDQNKSEHETSPSGMKGLKQEYWLRLRKMLSMEAKDSVQKEMLAVSAATPGGRGKKA